MRRIGFLMASILPWLAASSSHAQVRDGDIRLYLDGALVSWTKQVSETELAGLRSKDETTTVAAGLLGGGGGLGYAVTPHLVPELYVALQNVKIKTDGGELTLRQWELRPCLEVPLLPAQRFVPFLIGGLSLGRTVTKEGDEEVTMFGLGPALGAGAHAFLTEHASLDLSLVFRGTFFVKNDASEGLLDDADLKVKHYALLLNVGASFWL
jgi:hypothetical protein